MTEPAELSPADVPQSSAAAASNSPADRVRELWRSEELLGEKTEVLIQHGSETYRLRRTRQGKLILYK
jgi:hemin uptake protein HemP